MVFLFLQEKATQLEGSEICAIATMCVTDEIELTRGTTECWNWRVHWRLTEYGTPLQGGLSTYLLQTKRKTDKHFLSETTQTPMYEFEYSIRFWFTLHWGTSLHFLILPNQSDVTVFLSHWSLLRPRSGYKFPSMFNYDIMHGLVSTLIVNQKISSFLNDYIPIEPKVLLKNSSKYSHNLRCRFWIRVRKDGYLSDEYLCDLLWKFWITRSNEYMQDL